MKDSQFHELIGFLELLAFLVLLVLLLAHPGWADPVRHNEERWKHPTPLPAWIHFRPHNSSTPLYARPEAPDVAWRPPITGAGFVVIGNDIRVYAPAGACDAVNTNAPLVQCPWGYCYLGTSCPSTWSGPSNYPLNTHSIYTD